MARWKLANAHYLPIPDTDWEYQEVDRKTGRNVRRKFTVPRYLDPRDPGDWNNTWGMKDNQEGEIIVCVEGKGEPRDYVFSGDPTPDMIPLDPEATEISSRFTKRWAYKPETDMPGNFSQSLVDKFQSEIAEVAAKPVEIAGLSDLVAAITAQSTQTGAIIKALASRRV